MHRNLPRTTLQNALNCQLERELQQLLHHVRNRCAVGLLERDSALAIELHRRVDDDGQSLAEAAAALEIGVDDCSYLLGGFRRDLSDAIVRELQRKDTE